MFDDCFRNLVLVGEAKFQKVVSVVVRQFGWSSCDGGLFKFAARSGTNGR